MSARKQLEAIAELAQALAVGWPQYESTEAALGASSIPAGGGGVHGGDMADPVYAAMLSHERYSGNCRQISDVLMLLRDVQGSVSGVRRHQPELAREVDAARAAARCDGSVDPTCTDNAVRTIEGHALCWKCIKRQQRAEEKADRPVESSPDCGHSCCASRSLVAAGHVHYLSPSACPECIDLLTVNEAMP